MSRESQLEKIKKEFPSASDMAQDQLISEHEKTQSERSRDVLADIFNPERVEGFSTGIGSLDELIGGIRVQTCTVIGGATGHGKSLLGINLLVNLAKSAVKVCYIDLENGAAESFERILGIWFEKDQSWFRDIKNFEQAFIYKNEIDKMFLYYSHDELYGMGFAEKGALLIEQIIQKHARLGVKVFLIDPLQAIETVMDASAAFNEQGFFVRRMKDLAQSLDVAIIVLHHLRKTTASRGKSVYDNQIDEPTEVKYVIPDLDDLRGSGKIADFATDVWLIFRPASSPIETYRTKMLLRVAKNRTGLKGDIKLRLSELTLKIRERTNWDLLEDELRKSRDNPGVSQDEGLQGSLL